MSIDTAPDENPLAYISDEKSLAYSPSDISLPETRPIDAPGPTSQPQPPCDFTLHGISLCMFAFTLPTLALLYYRLPYVTLGVVFQIVMSAGLIYLSVGRRGRAMRVRLEEAGLTGEAQARVREGGGEKT